MGRLRNVIMLLLIAALLLVMLAWDLNLPAGVVHGIPYVVLISVSYWLPWRYASVVLAAMWGVAMTRGCLANRLSTAGSFA